MNGPVFVLITLLGAAAILNSLSIVNLGKRISQTETAISQMEDRR